MNFTLLLTVAVSVCLIGILLRLYVWFSQGIHPPAATLTLPQRLAAAGKALGGALFGPRSITVLKSIFLDLLFQQRVFDKNTLRWIAHGLIFTGFLLLFFLHALDSLITERLFSDYQSTLDPYLFLRNLFGLMVLAGVAIAVYRRITLRPQRLMTYAGDWAALIFVGGIILSGMLLEGAKISSYSTFQRMLDDTGITDEQEIQALAAYWIEKNGLVIAHNPPAITPELVAQGQEISAGSCGECHAANSSAFVSFGLAKITGPLMASGEAGAVSFLWYLHILFCLTFLAWLPFSKMFHIISAPVSLIITRIMGKENGEPANVLTRQMIGLSACTHCGACSLECSSNMFFESFHNDFILPSEKVQFLKHIAAGKELDSATLKKLQQGLYICTSCDRCTNICPSGINLKELFVSSRYALLDRGIPETSMLSHFSFPLALAQSYTGDHLKALKIVEQLFRKSFTALADMVRPLTLERGGTFANPSYRSCYACQRCTNICPVVRSYDNPGEALGMLPHQIIFSLGIGKVDLAMGAKMIWSCSTCYLCQEHCPNQVELCDIFYGLKNAAIARIEEGGRS
ncbi:MAG: 4Fe-4S dicluster domain-containing protein [Desulfoprunum sp.]|uniref:4Fe-4S dicluster domain-containing protein n=1 Tax=Desulfoprunum sp. TaxID=2020866 RepID=UPI003C78631B